MVIPCPTRTIRAVDLGPIVEQWQDCSPASLTNSHRGASRRTRLWTAPIADYGFVTHLDQSRILVDIRPQSYFDQRRRAAARVSVFAVLDRPLEQLLATRFASFRTVHLCTAGQLRAARFELVATGRRPHFTVRLPTAGDDELGALLAVLGPARDNPEYGKSTAQPGEA